jgi:hypothetical protein
MWLIPHVDDHQCGYITKLEKEKELVVHGVDKLFFIKL